MTDVAQAAPRDQWFGHPRGLTVLFLTEMWEKFSYFGMRAILVYYMTKALMISQGRASVIYGLYTGAAYFTPLIGGLLADRWLGRRRAVILGGSIMAAGHFMMAFEPLFYPALTVIAVGNGLFLPTLPSQVASLYRPDDPKRAWAYNVYYVGINLGAFLAPFVCGTLGEVYGWHYGFAAAGVGMLCGLVVYTWGTRYLPSQVVQARTAAERARAEQAKAQRTSAAGEDDLLGRFGLLCAVVAAVVIFRGAYEQLGNTLALWADAGVDRRVAGGWSIPMTWFQSINPLVVFLLTPVFVARWARLAAKGRESSTLVKMALGAAIVGGSYLAIAAVSLLAERAGGKASWLWLAAFLVVLTAGELYILPVGLGLFGRLAPPRLTAFTIAVWFFAISFGNALAGWLGSFWSRLAHAEFFALVGMVSLASGVFLFALDRPVRRLEAGAQTDLTALHLET